MKTCIIIIMLVFLMLYFVHETASSITICECKEKTIEQNARRSFAIFSGTVREKHLDIDNHRYKIKFDVHDSWEVVDNETVSVYTSADDAYLIIKDGYLGCGYNFEIGKSYLVYSYRDKKDRGPSWVSRCGGTKPLEGAEEDLKFLGKPVYSVIIK